ncbi:MAG: hypothetical protein ACYDC1_08610 [Limisphaerales bacterium]
MGFFRKKNDPLGERERELKARIASLEGEIRGLNHQIVEDQAQPKLRSTAKPGGPGPAFEPVRPPKSPNPFETETTPEHFNEFGARKFDLLAPLRRWWNQFHGTPAANPKLVSYLAAGSIHGLRPLRYEKRVARNRFLALCAFFIAILWGLIYFFLRNR